MREMAVFRASSAPPSPESASAAPWELRASTSACSARASQSRVSSYSPPSGFTASICCSVKRASSSWVLEALAVALSSSRAVSAARASARASRKAAPTVLSRSAQPSRMRPCSAGFSSDWYSCCPQSSTSGPTVRASSDTLAMAPFIVARLRPSALTLRTATSSSAVGSEGNRRPRTSAFFAPSRTQELSARSPTSSFTALTSAVFPAPVSPVRTVRRGEGEREASRMRATSFTWISSIMVPR